MKMLNFCTAHKIGSVKSQAKSQKMAVTGKNYNENLGEFGAAFNCAALL